MSPEVSTTARLSQPLASFGMPDTVSAARRAGAAWSSLPVRQRLKVVREIRHRLAEQMDDLAATVTLPSRRVAETLAAEILPLADACRFLEREAEALLAPRPLGRRGRPFWLSGSAVELWREPFGVVLILGPSNYPLLLPGVQALQALVAGNAVLLKPGRGASEAARRLTRLMAEAGVPDGLVTLLDEDPETAREAISAGVDKVLLTGSSGTGEQVLGDLAASVTPATLELSGCDAVFVRQDADLGLLARALLFGATFNGSFTCIAPRRVFVHRAVQAELESRLASELAEVAPSTVSREIAVSLRRATQAALDGGARLACGEIPAVGVLGEVRLRPLVLADVESSMEIVQSDLPAPLLSLIPVGSEEEALVLDRDCPFHLGASIFGDAEAARALAERIDAGVVVINDLIVPTADPRVPFGGRGASGFGVTRGAEGLLELTRVKAVIRRGGKFRPHFEPSTPEQENLMRSFVRLGHSRGIASRLRAMLEAARVLISTQKTHSRARGERDAN